MRIASEKARIRKVALARRRVAKSDATAEREANAQLDRVLESIGRFKMLAGYLPIGTEISPISTMTSVLNRGARVCVPVVEKEDSPLLFRDWSTRSTLVNARFGTVIPESGETVVPDVVIVPLVAFDGSCHRLGYGGGFYDRTLELLRKDAQTIRSSVFAIGLAFAAQRFPTIPHNAHDQQLDSIVTESYLESP